jgi:fructokinase
VITVMGEALIDLLVDRDGNVTSSIGGGELNKARALARLGVPVSFLGGLSRDSLGRRIRRALEADGVAIALPNATHAPTTLAIASLATDGSATYRFLLQRTSVTEVTPSAALDAVPANTAMLLTGGIGMALSPFAEAIVAVVNGAPADCIVMIDPNVRPAIVDSHPQYRATLEALLVRADIIKVSAEDLHHLFPNRDCMKAARSLHKHRGAVVIVTDGGKEVCIVTAQGEDRCAVPETKVVDTVGAGDAFSGGFAAWIFLQGFTRASLQDITAMTSAVQAAIAVATVTCQRQGADPPHRSDLPDDWSNRL